MSRVKRIFKTAFQALKEYRKKKPLQLASSTSFFTLFALPPILIILITILGMIFKTRMLHGSLFREISNILGESSADQVAEILQNFTSITDNIWTSLAGFIFLIFVATNLFMIIKTSINELWDVHVVKKRSFKSLMIDRGLSFIIVMIGGVLFLVTLLSDAFVAFLGDGLEEILPSVDALIIRILNGILSLAIVSVWFTLLFKILPSAKIRWSPAIYGGIFTAFLFNVGKHVLGIFLVNGNIDSVFGASASIILLLLFIFYAALIFYYGAFFTMKFAEAIKKPIHRGGFSVGEKLEVDED